MANQCGICEDRHVETSMMILGNLWCEFCANCADCVCLQSPEGERKTPREVWNSISPDVPCPFPVKERFERPDAAMFDDLDNILLDELAYLDAEDYTDPLPPADLEDRETLAEMPVRSMSRRRAWNRDGFISAKGPKGRGWRKPRNRLRDKRLAA